MRRSPHSEPQLALDLHDMVISSLVGSTEYVFKSTNHTRTALHYTFFSVLSVTSSCTNTKFFSAIYLQQTNLYSSVQNMHIKKKNKLTFFYRKREDTILNCSKNSIIKSLLSFFMSLILMRYCNPHIQNCIIRKL
jgi:hypothetical protein